MLSSPDQLRTLLTNSEPQVQQIGRGLLNRARAGRPWFSGDRLMRPLMRHPQLRAAALRFVDVLPTLATARDLTSHLEEYFRDVDLPLLSRSVRGAVLRAAQSPWLSAPTAWMVRTIAGRMARRFIAGADLKTIDRALAAMHRRGMAFTLDLLGEAVVSEAEADEYQRQYARTLAGLDPVVRQWAPNPQLDRIGPRAAPRLNLSIKISALYSQISPADPRTAAEAIKARLRPILLDAQRRGAFITLDMEHYDTKAITLRVFRELLTEQELRHWPDAGIAMQAYLRDTPADLASLIDWAEERGTPVMVRLVRGAYWDFEVVHAQQHGWPIPVWTSKQQTDSCYEYCLAMLLSAHPRIETAVATHNVRSLAVAIALSEWLGLAAGDYEAQMLYGMADELKRALVDEGLRLRVYVPFGELIPGMAYLVRRLLENTASQSFLRMGFAEDTDAQTLLAAPEVYRG